MCRRSAFTLVELLVTMVVGSLLIVFLFQLFNATAGAWRSGEDQTDTYREARAALQIMVRDIGATAAPVANVTPTPSPAPSPSSSPASGLTPVLVLDRYANSGATADPPMESGDEINEELYCLTNIPNNGASSLCAVGYFCMWMPDLIPPNDPQYAQRSASAPHAYALVRQFLGSGSPATATAAAIPGLFERFNAVTSKTTPLSFINVYERARPPVIPSPMPSPPLSVGTQLASFIWDLQFRTPSHLQTAPATPDYPANPPTASGGYPGQLPAYVEIRFKALSARAARQLEGNTRILRTSWNDGQVNDKVYKRIIQPATRQFVARVPIGNGNATLTP